MREIHLVRDMALAFLRIVHPVPMKVDDIRNAINFYISEFRTLEAARDAIVADMYKMIFIKRSLH